MASNHLYKSLKGIIHCRRKKSGKVMEDYFSSLDVLQKFIENDLIAFNMPNHFVVLDHAVHLLFMEDDARYEAFFDKVAAYMNLALGALGAPMLKPEDPLYFNVVMKNTVLSTDPQDMLHTKIETVLIGCYQYGHVDYKPYNDSMGTDQQKEDNF